MCIATDVLDEMQPAIDSDIDTSPSKMHENNVNKYDVDLHAKALYESQAESDIKCNTNSLIKEHINMAFSNKKESFVDEMCLLDDELTRHVFDNNIEATELLLNIILNRKDIKVNSVDVQKQMTNQELDGRSVILDVFAQDSEGKFYDIEVQRADKGADAHRARFYSSMLDVRMLKRGQDMKELHDSYVIFITEKDVLKENEAMCHIIRKIDGKDKYFQDGSHIIYVNGSYEKSVDTNVFSLYQLINIASPKLKKRYLSLTACSYAQNLSL